MSVQSLQNGSLQLRELTISNAYESQASGYVPETTTINSVGISTTGPIVTPQIIFPGTNSVSWSNMAGQLRSPNIISVPQINLGDLVTPTVLTSQTTETTNTLSINEGGGALAVSQIYDSTGSLGTEGQILEINGDGKIEWTNTAPGGITSVGAGTGISVTGTTDITITNTGITSIEAGTGISVGIIDGVSTITNTAIPTITSIESGTGIDVQTVDGVSTITNTAIPTITSIEAGTGIDVQTVDGVSTITNTAIPTITSIESGTGISVQTVDGVSTITNTAIPTVTSIESGTGISVQTVDGVSTITNTVIPTITSIESGTGIDVQTVDGVSTINATATCFSIVVAKSVSIPPISSTTFNFQIDIGAVSSFVPVTNKTVYIFSGLTSQPNMCAVWAGYSGGSPGAYNGVVTGTLIFCNPMPTTCEFAGYIMTAINNI
jgi:hypothetical protein